MEKFKRVEDVENRLEAIDAERVSLLKELRDLRAKERATNPSFALDERTYPETAEERVALFERLCRAQRHLSSDVGERQNRSKLKKRIFGGGKSDVARQREDGEAPEG